MKGDMVAFFNLSDRGETVAERVFVGGLLIGVVLSLIPMPQLARVGVIAAGAVAAYVFAGVHGDGPEDVFAWGVVMTVGVIGWFIGFVPAALVRAAVRVADRDSKRSK